MGFLTKAKAKSSSSSSSSGDNRGMGLLLVFFPEDNSAIADKSKLFSSTSSSASSPSSSSPSSSKSLSNSFRRTTSNALLSKAQSTISICVLLLFITLLLFTLSTFEPTINTTPRTTPRRFLMQKAPTILIPEIPTSKSKAHHWFPKLWRPESYSASKIEFIPSSTALQRMGTLYRRGTRAMNDLVVGHVVEDTTDDELRFFLRVTHRSGLTARADIVFIFASASSSSRFGSIIREENDMFLSLIDRYSELNLTQLQKPKSNFDVTRFFKLGKKGEEIGEPLWGKRIRSNNFSNPDAGETELDSESIRLSYGSVLSFDATELDPENSLAGFLDHVPLSLRRWACYPMLLGRVRRNFKHIMLVDVKNLMVVNDPLGRVRNRSSESVFLYNNKPESSPTSKHIKKNSEKTQARRSVNSAIIMGGARGIRRISNAMLLEIVRAAIQHKKKNSVSESVILSQLVGNEFMVKNVNLITSSESIPESSSLGGRNAAASKSMSDYSLIYRGTSNQDLNSAIKKQLCRSAIDSSVYRDC